MNWGLQSRQLSDSDVDTGDNGVQRVKSEAEVRTTNNTGCQDPILVGLL